jgi:hypothetical protein
MAGAPGLLPNVEYAPYAGLADAGCSRGRNIPAQGRTAGKHRGQQVGAPAPGSAAWGGTGANATGEAPDSLRKAAACGVAIPKQHHAVGSAAHPQQGPCYCHHAGGGLCRSRGRCPGSSGVGGRDSGPLHHTCVVVAAQRATTWVYRGHPASAASGICAPRVLRSAHGSSRSGRRGGGGIPGGQQLSRGRHLVLPSSGHGGCMGQAATAGSPAHQPTSIL